MIFGRRPMSPLAQRIRKSGHIYPLSAISMESVDNLGRRRSLSLDDLGIKTSSNQFNHNDLTSPPSLSSASNLGSPTIIDDTDDELDDLPLEEISEQECKRDTELEVSSLSTIRENSPVNSVEEWSPSPAEESEDNQLTGNGSQSGNNSISGLNNRDNKNRQIVALHEDSNHKARVVPKGFVQNTLSKWKNMMKK